MTTTCIQQEYPNLLLRLDDNAVITKCVLLPDSFPDQVRFGFEGVAEDGDYVVVTIQRAWGNDANPRLAVYNQDTESWKYAFYPLDVAESQNGGWVGLSDIAPLGHGHFLVLERDNQGGPDAAIKRIYKIDLGDFTFADGTTVEKVLFKDIVQDLAASKGGIIEKVEGLAVTKCGAIWINTDNDGVDDNSGEQLLLNVGNFGNKKCGGSGKNTRGSASGKNSRGSMSGKNTGGSKSRKKTRCSASGKNTGGSGSGKGSQKKRAGTRRS